MTISRRDILKGAGSAAAGLAVLDLALLDAEGGTVIATSEGGDKARLQAVEALRWRMLLRGQDLARRWGKASEEAHRWPLGTKFYHPGRVDGTEKLYGSYYVPTIEPYVSTLTSSEGFVVPNHRSLIYGSTDVPWDQRPEEVGLVPHASLIDELGDIDEGWKQVNSTVRDCEKEIVDLIASCLGDHRRSVEQVQAVAYINGRAYTFKTLGPFRWSGAEHHVRMGWTLLSGPQPDDLEVWV